MLLFNNLPVTKSVEAQVRTIHSLSNFFKYRNTVSLSLHTTFIHH